MSVNPPADGGCDGITLGFAVEADGDVEGKAVCRDTDMKAEGVRSASCPSTFCPLADGIILGYADGILLTLGEREGSLLGVAEGAWLNDGIVLSEGGCEG